ncbi:MAG: S1/P1 nuclease, partial [Gemmatimonadota bacterium]|nr:S1/P1 nuclease [Gemmatimonadota bacterium]
LIHFVADIHQPLHAGYARDRGGNSTRVVFLGDSTNLHWVWDGALLTALGLGPHAADRLHAAIRPVDRHLWHDTDPARWADESFQLVEHQVYVGTGDGPLGAPYVEQHRHVIHHQLLKAGVRLGALLNRLLGT